MVDVFLYRDGTSSDDVICGHIRAAASIASPVFDHLPAARAFLGDQRPQPLSHLRRILALAGDDIVGFVDFDPPVGYVKLLFVLPVWQGRGIARTLLSRAATCSTQPLNLKTQSVNDRALAFYLGVGFDVTKAEVEADWHGAQVVWLTLCRDEAP